MPRIDGIRIHHFRGASAEFDIKFAKDKKLVVIFGENGTGKTTIVDALDAVGNCSGGSLTTKSSTSLKDHLPTAGKKAADMIVEVSAGNTTWQATLRRNDIVTTPDPRPAIRVLRRTNLQRFIDSQPAKRYEEVRHLIGVEQVERAEGALKRASDGVRQQLDDAARTRATGEDQLERIWQEEGRPGRDWMTWAAEVAGEDAAELAAQARGFRATSEAIGNALRIKDEWGRAEVALNQRRQELTVIEAGVESQPGVNAERAIEMAEMLGRVREHLGAAEQRDQCPVCEQSVNLEQLKSDLDRRLEELERYQTLSRQRQAARTRLQSSIELAEEKRADLVDAAAHLMTTVMDKPSGFAPLTIQTLTDLTAADVSAEPDEVVARSAVVIDACASHLEPLQAQADSATGAAAQVNAIGVLNAAVEASRTSTIGLEQILKGLAASHDLVRSTRIEYTQRILDDVAEECNRLYSAIHPDEGLAISKVELDQRQRASLNQVVHFGEYTNVPPQAYFSEAHLDTLGFCFWLAFAKHEISDGDGILVLDDVFTSVDSQHRRRLADLVVEEVANFAQVIITTHDRNWLDYFRNPNGPGNLTDLIQLQPWSIAKGISSYGTILALQDLVNAINASPFERQTVASKAGVLLEATLDALALQYRCRVARTMDNVYDLGELLAGTASLFKCLEIQKPAVDTSGQPIAPVQPTAVHPKDVLSDLRATVLVRNQVGAHHNVYGASLADGDVKEFAELTVHLVRSLVCEVCGQIPSIKTGTHFKCSCKEPHSAHMTPLQLGN